MDHTYTSHAISLLVHCSHRLVSFKQDKISLITCHYWFREMPISWSECVIILFVRWRRVSLIDQVVLFAMSVLYKCHQNSVHTNHGYVSYTESSLLLLSSTQNHWSHYQLLRLGRREATSKTIWVSHPDTGRVTIWKQIHLPIIDIRAPE